jgi:tetratricopeptide (TPR) repeat protein
MTPTMETDSIRFRSFDALRTEHEALLSSTQSNEGTLGSVPTPTIRVFLSRAAATGSIIIDPHERRSAQNMLRFWAAELITRGVTDWTLPSLAAPQLGPIKAEGDSAEKSNASDQDLARSRALVRIAASARQWLETRDSGWLLKGDALREAEKFVNEDDDIRALVAASRAARASVIKTAVVTTLVVVVVLAFLVYAVFPWLAARAEQSIARADTRLNQTWAIYLLGKFQPILPPPNFVGPTSGRIERVHLPELNLHAPNFSRLTLHDINLDGAQLSSAAFTLSTIGDSSFASTKLSSAQFREATISSTSFAQARLDLAAFDRAVFTKVDFSGADLSSTSFWGASFDDTFETRFKDTPWWFAQGWNSCQIKVLVRTGPSSSVLKQTPAFAFDTDEPKRRLANVAPGSVQRALALNDLAWALATWGADLQSRDPASAKDDATCLTATGVPDNATDAARQAVCIAQKLTESSTMSADVLENIRANIGDTYGYVLLQTGQIQAAVTNLDRATEVLKNDGDVLFHAAVAHYAAGDNEKASAILEQSTQYSPRITHELWTLRAYLNPAILDWNDSIWPVPATTVPCRPPG